MCDFYQKKFHSGNSRTVFMHKTLIEPFAQPPPCPSMAMLFVAPWTRSRLTRKKEMCIHVVGYSTHVIISNCFNSGVPLVRRCPRCILISLPIISHSKYIYCGTSMFETILIFFKVLVRLPKHVLDLFEFMFSAAGECRVKEMMTVDSL